MKKSPLPAASLAEDIKNCMDKVLYTLAPSMMSPEQHFPQPSINKPRILVNLSNHPCDKWSEEQMNKAKKYGKCLDMPFPIVDATTDEEGIARLSNKLVGAIMKLMDDYVVTVHVMGEMNLTFNIVSKLRSHGVTCIASTTERITEDLTDGSKRSEFHFKKFRKYT